jgi:hypothetical protein
VYPDRWLPKFRWALRPPFSALVTIYIPGNIRWQEFGSHIMSLQLKRASRFIKICVCNK